jgi:hypothetical protein
MLCSSLSVKLRYTFLINFLHFPEKGFRNLVAGEDSELTAAYDHFHKMVEQKNGAVRNATLAGVEQLKKDGVATHEDVKFRIGPGRPYKTQHRNYYREYVNFPHQFIVVISKY